MHARCIGYELTGHLTVRPADNDELTLQERQARWTAFYKGLDQYCRDRGFALVAAWSRESDPATGNGEHWHVLMHVPRGHWKHLKATMARRFPGRKTVDLRWCDQDVRTTKDGVPYTAVDYLRKAMPTTVRWGRPFYKASGPIYGKRAGVTRNIGPSAIRAWEAHKRRLSA